MYQAVGIIELKSIAKGVEACDAALKSAGIKLVSAHPSCPGKYEIIVTGAIADVDAAISHVKSRFDGNIIDEKTMSAEYANLDVNRFGKYIAFLSLKRYGEDENPGSDSFAVLYDTETDKLMEFTPETADEAGCMGISPDGKIAVTMDYEEVDDDGIVTGQKQTLRYYDIESGKVIKTVNADDKPALNNFVVYDDGVIQTVPGYNKEKNERTETVVFFDRFDD